MLECLMSGSLFGWLAGNNTSGDGPSRQESRNLLNVRIIHVRTCGVSSEARPCRTVFFERKLGTNHDTVH